MSDEAWAAAGGDLQRLALYRAVGQVEGVVAGSGRVLAGINPDHFPVGCLGDLSGDTATIAAGERWLREQGCVAVQAPLQLTTWFPYRANLGPFEQPPFFGEPVASPVMWQSAGYREVARYASAIAANAPVIEYGRARPLKRIKFRPMGDFEEAITTIHFIATAAFRDAYAYSPLPLEVMRQLYLPFKDIVPAEMIIVAEEEGEPVGFVYGYPDILQPGRRRFVIKTLAVLPRMRKVGLGARLVGELHAVGEKMGLTHGIHALMWAGSRSRSISKHGGQIFREYALFLKEL